MASLGRWRLRLEMGACTASAPYHVATYHLTTYLFCKRRPRDSAGGVNRTANDEKKGSAMSEAVRRRQTSRDRGRTSAGKEVGLRGVVRNRPRVLSPLMAYRSTLDKLPAQSEAGSGGIVS